MNNLTHTLSSNSVTSAGVDVYESGKTAITFSLAGIHRDASKGYLKFVADYGDGSDLEVVQDITDTWSLSSKSISHTFFPSDRYVTSYTAQISGFRTDLQIDIYKFNVKIGQNSVTSYKDIKIIESKLYTTPAGKNNLFLTIETQEPHFIGNLIIPEDKVDIAALLGEGIGDVLQELDLNRHLRTEVYSKVGGLESIVTEKQTFIIEEGQLLLYVIANELHGIWSGRLSSHTGDQAESIAILIDDTAVMTDINGNIIDDPTLILIPEFDTDSTYDSDVDFTRKVGLPYR